MRSPIPFLSDWWGGLDVADRTSVLRIAFWSWFGLSAGTFIILHARGAQLVLLLFVINPFLSACFARIVFGMIAHVANAAVLGLSGASGGDPYKMAFSVQEAMVIRGDWRTAIDSYRTILVSEPENHEARLRMARLFIRNGLDPTEAEACYLEVRRTDRERIHEREVANALIDLYRAKDREADLRRELTRLAQRHPGTPHGDGARLALRAMVSEATQDDTG